MVTWRNMPILRRKSIAFNLYNFALLYPFCILVYVTVFLPVRYKWVYRKALLSFESWLIGPNSGGPYSLFFALPLPASLETN